MSGLLIAIAPVIIILCYIWFRDKYEKEPIGLLLKSVIAGAVIVVPVIFVETGLQRLHRETGQIYDAAYQAFVVAAFTEEAFKFLALYLLIWWNKNFNEKFDGIVYAVFISLGFATVENILYVAEGGMSVGMVRAITAVPGHALFGVVMGYYFGIAHMYPELRRSHLIRAFTIPLLLHGVYDFLLMSAVPLLLLAFIPYLVYLYIQGFRRMKTTSDASIFRDVPEDIET